MEIKTARACPLGMAIDELYFELQRLKQRLADWQATSHLEAASHD